MSNSSSAEKLIGLGAEIAGTVAATAAGLLALGPGGAVAASMLSPLIAHNLRELGGEVHARLLGPREEIRAGAVLAYATVKIEENLRGGREVRDDDYFSVEERSAADEVAERALLAAQREPEEKKVPFYGNLIGNLAFRAEIDRPTANLLVRLGEGLSYQQLVLLAVFLNKDQFKLSPSNVVGMELTPSKIALLQEALDLYHRGLLGADSVVLDLGGLTPGDLRVQGMGIHLYSLMELHRIAPVDLERAGAALG